jgi:DmX-like protein
MRRLWCYLVRQEKVQDIFIRLVFGKRVNHQTHQTTGTSNADAMSVYSDAAAQDDYTDSITAVSGGAAERMPDPVRIIHKDQDIIGAFCINSVITTFRNWRYFPYWLVVSQTNPGILAVSNGKEIQELDITPLLDAPSNILEDECEIDLLGLDR